MRIGVKFMSVNLATIGFLWLKGWVKWTKMCKKALDSFKFLLHMPLRHHIFYNSLIATLKNIENTVLLLFFVMPFMDEPKKWYVMGYCHALFACIHRRGVNMSFHFYWLMTWPQPVGGEPYYKGEGQFINDTLS